MSQYINNYEKHCLLPRRQFLKRAFGTAALAPFILGLEKVAAAAVPQTTDDYKALVCVFMLGGNDATGTVLPYSLEPYNYYASKRQTAEAELNFLVPRNQILLLSHNNPNSPEIGLHPNLSALQTLYAQNKMAVLANVGPLLRPTTKTQFENGSVPLPPNVFSHEDQILFWQTVTAGRPQNLTGWGGRMADLLDSLNTNPQVSMSVSLAGDNYFQLAGAVAQFNCSSGNVGGLIDYNATNDAVYRRANTIWNRASSNPLEQAWSQKMRRAVDQVEFLKDKLAAPYGFATAFPQGQLGPQVKRVAELIALRNQLGVKRQIFFCGIGGFDTHDKQQNSHPYLIKQVSDSIAALYNAIGELSGQDADIQKKVTIFTASDFGRTLNINGAKGTDHGWGGHHFIVGGAVNGGRLYGTYPNVAQNSDDDSGDGRWIPTTSVDQYGATLARWFGVSQGDLATVSPNLGYFPTANLGFMV